MKQVINKVRSIYAPISRYIHERWAVLFPEWYAKYLYKKTVNRKLDLENPKDFNEKTQWLKLYSDTAQWTDLADKYKVREYIKQCGFEDKLVKIYGVWERAEDIDFSKLPDKFVLKTNHGFKKVIVVEEKSKLDINLTIRQLNKWVQERYGLVSFEPHYWNIERKIIAEEYLEDDFNKKYSASLIDYKIWCIHGEPQVVSCLYDRSVMSVGSSDEKDSSGLKSLHLDLDWNPLPEITIPTGSGSLSDFDIPKPARLDEMIRIARTLSSPFASVRVDLYDVHDQVYFGEMTFTPGGNYQIFTREYDLELGQKIDLSKVKRRTKKSII